MASNLKDTKKTTRRPKPGVKAKGMDIIEGEATVAIVPLADTNGSHLAETEEVEALVPVERPAPRRMTKGYAETAIVSLITKAMKYFGGDKVRFKELFQKFSIEIDEVRAVFDAGDFQGAWEKLREVYFSYIPEVAAQEHARVKKWRNQVMHLPKVAEVLESINDALKRSESYFEEGEYERSLEVTGWISRTLYKRTETQSSGDWLGMARANLEKEREGRIARS